MNEEVSVTLSTAFLSKRAATVWAPTAPSRAEDRAPVQIPAERVAMRQCAIGRRSLGVVEVALRAPALRDTVVAKWVRDCGVAVEVRTGEELGIAIAVGVHPMRLTVLAGGLSANELVFCTANLGVGRMVVDSVEQIGLLTSAAVRHRRQRVLLEMTRGETDRGFGFGTRAADAAVAAVQAAPRLDLVGLHCEIGAQEHHYVSYPAAIGDMLAEMTQIRRTHNVVLTRVGLSGRGLVFGDGPSDLSDFAAAIDETLDDACATLRFPRPVVMVSAEPAERELER